MSYGGRPSCATPPGSRALCEVGLAAWFLFLRSVLVRAIGPQRHIPAYREYERGLGRGQNLFLARGCRPSCATPPGPRALCEVVAPAWDSGPLLGLSGRAARRVARAPLRTAWALRGVAPSKARFFLAPRPFGHGKGLAVSESQRLRRRCSRARAPLARGALSA